MSGKSVWFKILKQWREQGKGEYGVTLPFLVGALSYSGGLSNASREDIVNLFRDMTEYPVAGYFVEIRWCASVGDPVLSIKEVNDPEQAIPKVYFERPDNNGSSVVFTYDLVATLCPEDTTAQICKENLIEYVLPYVVAGSFSKSFNQATGKKEYGKFSDHDIAFIKQVLAQV